MDYCGPRGIPLSEFLSWHIDDQAAALGWMSESAQRCSNCGTAEWEWDGDPDAFTAKAKVCPGCHMIGVEQKGREEHAKAIPGLKVYLERAEPMPT